MPEKVEVEFVGNPDDLIADAKRVQAGMDQLSAKIKAAGVSQAAYNQAVASSKKPAMDAKAAEEARLATMQKQMASYAAIQKQKADALAAQDKEKLSWTDLKSAIDLAGMALQKVKQGYDFAKEGAQIEFAKMKFDRLAQSIGTTGDALLQKLKVATKGTMSDMEAMASATDLVSLGLVKTESDAVRLSSVVAGLGMDMNQLVLALSNQTTMRFDQLGVAVVGFDEKVKALEKTGMSANDAFTEAFLQQAEEQLKKVGNAADTAAGEFARFEAELKNFKDTAKQTAAQALTPLIETTNDYHEAAKKVDELYPDLIPRERQHMIALQMQADAYYESKEAIEGASVSLEDYAGRVETVAAKVKASSMTQDEFNAEMKGLGEILQGDLMQAQEEYNEKIEEYREKLEEARTEKEKDQINANIAAETAAYNERAEAIAFNIQQEAILNSQLPPETKISMITALGVAYGMYDQKTADAIATTQTWIERVQEGTLAEEAAIQYMKDMTHGLQETGEAADGATPPIDNMNSALFHGGQRGKSAADGYGVAKDAAAELGDVIRSDASPAVGGLNSQLGGMPASGTMWSYYFNIHTSGSVPKVPGAGGNPGGPGPVGGDSGTGCFLAGTLITLADGTRKRIELIQIGDTVRAYNTERGEFVEAAVSQTFRHTVGGYLNIDGLLVTPEHPLWVRDAGWVKAGEVRRDDRLFRDYGGHKTIDYIIPVTATVEVYNLEVEGVHTYFAGGVLVHNKEKEFMDSGGRGSAGQMYMIGRGAQPEAFIPSTNGTFIPNADQMFDASGIIAAIEANALDPRTFARTLVQEMQKVWG